MKSKKLREQNLRRSKKENLMFLQKKQIKEAKEKNQKVLKTNPQNKFQTKNPVHNH